MRGLHGHDLVDFAKKACSLRWRCVDAAHLGDVLVGHPTGVRATSSDVDGHFMGPQLRQQFTHRRYSDAFGSFDAVVEEILGPVARQEDDRLVVHLQRRVWIA
jgi:hypothetical protein